MATITQVYPSYAKAGDSAIKIIGTDFQDAPLKTKVYHRKHGETSWENVDPTRVTYVSATELTVAIDAATCKPKWRHRWQPLAGEVWTRNRGVAVKDGRVVRGTDDGYLLALDAATGEMLWARKAADTTLGETFTMATMIFEDLVLIGPAGSENGISGWVGAFRLSDGTPVWRFKTVPGAREGGNPSWGNPKNIVLGGGSVWTPLSLDPEKGELYAAVSNPAPDLPAHLRPGGGYCRNQ